MEPSGIVCSDFLHQFLTIFCSNFQGVYAKDTIPDHLTEKNRFSIVVNLSPSNHPGSHFVSIIRQKDTLLYFDSLILPIPKEVSNFIKKLKVSNAKRNFHQIQDESSDFCGYYCMLACLHFCDQDFEYGIKFPMFHRDALKRNDLLCLNYILKNLNEIDRKIK